MRRWEEIFTEADRLLVEKSGFGRKQAYGNKSALLIIDVTMSFLGSTPQPVLRSAEEYATSCGEAGWTALDSIRRLLQVSRENGIPVIYTAVDITTCQLCGIAATKQKNKPAQLKKEEGNKI